MAAPEDLLALLRDIHLPVDAPAAAPATLAVPLAVALGLAVLALLLWRHWQRRPQALALRALRELACRHADDPVALARGVGALLRQQAMRKYPDAAVAGMVDDAWLAFLDAHCAGGGFRAGAGAALAHLPYQRGGTVDGDALLQLAQRWLRANPL